MSPSPWVKRFSGFVNGHVLDLACGGGRHGRLFLELGQSVEFADKNVDDLTDLMAHDQAQVTEIDLEDGRDWPFENDTYDAIIVTNYLYRPHLVSVLDSLRPDGVLLYETFALGNEQFGRPRNPDFLLKPGELLELVEGKLQVVAFEHGLDGEKVVQRICAVKGDGLRPLS